MPALQGSVASQQPKSRDEREAIGGLIRLLRGLCERKADAHNAVDTLCFEPQLAELVQQLERIKVQQSVLRHSMSALETTLNSHSDWVTQFMGEQLDSSFR
jgi:hypothetical protein